MRHILLAAPLFALALGSGCEAMGFGEGDSASTGSGGGKGGIGNVGGGAAGDPGGWTLGVGERPSLTPFDPNDPNTMGFDPPLPLCPGDWPVVTRAPGTYAGYASAEYARFSLLGSPKRLPDPEVLRVEDFLAYYGDREPIDGVTMDAHFVATDVDSGAGTPGYVEMRVRRDPSPSVEAKHFVLIVDVSPSMSAAGPRAQEILTRLAATLGSTEDEVSLITFAGDAQTVFDHKVGADMSSALEAAADGLTVRAGNDLEGAIKTALVLAKGALDDDSTPTELVLLTDGGSDIPPGVTDALAAARDRAVRTSVVQLAKGERSVIHDEFMDQLATAGGGTRLFIADAGEASRVFGERFDESFRTALSGVTLSVTLPSGFTSTEDSKEAGLVATGSSIGSGRWYSVRHHVTACAATLAAAGSSDEYVVDASLQASELPDGESFSIPFDEAFLGPSNGSLIEDSVVEAVQHLRSGGAEVTPAQTVNIDAAWAAFGCDATPSASCETLTELKALMVAASDLRGG